jgi:hypothetical protein
MTNTTAQISITQPIEPRRGWLCPTCNRSNSPDIASCDHTPAVAQPYPQYPLPILPLAPMPSGPWPYTVPWGDPFPNTITCSDSPRPNFT